MRLLLWLRALHCITRGGGGGGAFAYLNPEGNPEHSGQRKENLHRFRCQHATPPPPVGTALAATFLTVFLVPPKPRA